MDNNALRLGSDDNAEQACCFSPTGPDMSTRIKKQGLVCSCRAGFYKSNHEIPLRSCCLSPSLRL